MIITPFQIYLISRCDEINNALGLTCCLLLIALIVGTLTYFINFIYEDDDLKNEFLKWGKRILIANFIFMFLFIMCPTSKEVVAMISIPKIANSDFVNNEIPEGLRQLWNKVFKKEEK